MPEWTPELLAELARARGLALDARRAEALLPLVESLRGRLASLPDRLSPQATPPPDRVARAPR